MGAKGAGMGASMGANMGAGMGAGIGAGRREQSCINGRIKEGNDCALPLWAPGSRGFQPLGLRTADMRLCFSRRSKSSGGTATRCRVGRSPMPTIDVDTGFIVYNERNYPELTALLAHLDIATQPSCMSFADQPRWRPARIFRRFDRPRILAQKRNLARPSFAGMLLDIVALQPGSAATISPKWIAARQRAECRQSFLDQGAVRRAPSVTPICCPWRRPSGRHPLDAVLDFPGLEPAALLRQSRAADDQRSTRLADPDPSLGELCRADGDARSPDVCARGSMSSRSGGATASSTVRARDGAHRSRSDRLVLATHADQSLADDGGCGCRGARPFSDRISLPATTVRCCTAIRGRCPDDGPPGRAGTMWHKRARPEHGAPISVTYWMNRLQSIDERYPLFVSLNPAIGAARRAGHPWPNSTICSPAVRFRHALRGAGADEQRFRGAAGSGTRAPGSPTDFHEDGLNSGMAALPQALGCHAAMATGIHGRTRPGSADGGFPENAAAAQRA